MQEKEPLKAIIIDDEPGSRNNLRLLIQQYCPEVEIQGMAEDVEGGLRLIDQYLPDVVFLDIEMPRHNGFRLLDWLSGDELPEVIFTTAYEEYALRAFQVSAVGYLLKPIDIGELRKVVAKVQEIRNRESRPLRLQQLKNNFHGHLSKLVIPHQKGYTFVDIDDIIYIEASRNYSTLHTREDAPRLVSKPLKEFEDLFNGSGFFRPHRSFLINLQHVREYSKKDGGYLLMTDGQKVDIAQDRRQEFLRLFRHFL